MSQPDLKTTKRYYRSFMEWAQVCAPMQYMAMGLRTASKEEIVRLIREWAETITYQCHEEVTRKQKHK
jgi:hypothetical protein